MHGPFLVILFCLNSTFTFRNKAKKNNVLEKYSATEIKLCFCVANDLQKATSFNEIVSLWSIKNQFLMLLLFS